MLDPHFLEAMNGVWTVLSLCALLVFVRYLWRINDESGFGKKERTARFEAAVALTVYFFGEFLVRFWVWLWRHQINDGVLAGWMKNYPVLAVGGIIAAVGCLCVIRVFSTRDDEGNSKNRYWIASLIVALAVGVVLAL